MIVQHQCRRQRGTIAARHYSGNFSNNNMRPGSGLCRMIQTDHKLRR